MKKIIGIAVGFSILAMLSFLTINWVSTVPEPTNQSSSEYAVYQNLSDTTDIAFTGQEAVLLLVIVAMVFAGIFLIIKVVLK